MSRFVWFVCACLAPVGLPAVVRGQAAVCNETPWSYQLAFAVERQGEIISFGWRELPGDGCIGDLFEIAAQEGIEIEGDVPIWLHARDSIEGPAEEFGAGLRLCVDDYFDVFVAEFADSTCAKRGYIDASFTQMGSARTQPFILSPQGFR